MRLDRLAFLVFVAALVACGAPVGAQVDETAAPQTNEIYVENTATQRLTFGLSNDNEVWSRFELDPGQVAVFGGAADWYFLILTDGIELRYRLNEAGSYRLFWNETDTRWDLMTCSEPACGHLQ